MSAGRGTFVRNGYPDAVSLVIRFPCIYGLYSHEFPQFFLSFWISLLSYHICEMWVPWLPNVSASPTPESNSNKFQKFYSEQNFLKKIPCDTYIHILTQDSFPGCNFFRSIETAGSRSTKFPLHSPSNN